MTRVEETIGPERCVETVVDPETRRSRCVRREPIIQRRTVASSGTAELWRAGAAPWPTR